MSAIKYKRVLLKLSGEALMGDQQYGYDYEAITAIATDIKNCLEQGVEIAIVIGGGNICRGATIAKIGIERVSADYMGMLATVMNALALQSVLESMGIMTRVQSAITMTRVCEPYIRRKAIRHMEKGRVVIFAAGTGYPYFTTDTNAVLRAIEIQCDVILKGTLVDGVYEADPRLNNGVKKFAKLDYKTVLTNDKMAVMDSAAISLASENLLPIIVFNIRKAGALADVIYGKGEFTIITEGDDEGNY